MLAVRATASFSENVLKQFTSYETGPKRS